MTYFTQRTFPKVHFTYSNREYRT